MRSISVQKLARVLRVLVTITFVCNLLALLCVPTLAALKSLGGVAESILRELGYAVSGNVPDDHWPLPVFFLLSWVGVWYDAYTAVLTVFLLFCGCCTAVMLWQARRVLDTVLAGETFSFANAANMKRVAVCCLLISVAALARLIWGLIAYRSIGPLLTYNALFVPAFAMGFLLCMVMSALFRQAAEMKAENDLTI